MSISCSRSFEKINLKLDLKKGVNYKTKLIIEQEIAQKVMGQNQTIKQVISTTYSYKVFDVNPEGVMSIDITYIFVGFKKDGSMGHVDYDSQTHEGEVPLAASAFASLIGQTLSIKNELQ